MRQGLRPCTPVSPAAGRGFAPAPRFRLRRAGALPLHPTRGAVGPSGLPDQRGLRPLWTSLSGVQTWSKRRVTDAPHRRQVGDWRGIVTVAVICAGLVCFGKLQVGKRRSEGVQRATEKPSGRLRELLCRGRFHPSPQELPQEQQSQAVMA